MTAKLTGIFVSPRAGVAMEARQSITIHPGIGLDGDRYALSLGAYSRETPVKIRHVTLISSDSIDRANAWFARQGQPAIRAEETRRNLLVEGMSAEDMNALVGREFTLGNIRLRGIERADPCPRPTRLLGRSGFDQAFDACGGLRAEALSGGELRLGDVLV